MISKTAVEFVEYPLKTIADDSCLKNVSSYVYTERLSTKLKLVQLVWVLCSHIFNMYHCSRARLPK